MEDRPLWKNSVYWHRPFSEAMPDRHGDQIPSAESVLASSDDPEAMFAAMLDIWREEAISEHNQLCNQRQARLGAMGLLGGSDYVSALCETTKLATIEALTKTKSVPLAAQNQSIITKWTLSLFDELAARSNECWRFGRFAASSIQPLADRLHAEGRTIVERELTKWILGLRLSETPGPPTDTKGKKRVMRKPTVNAVADGPLKRWWNRLGSRAESMTHDELVAAARAAFPQNHVSRQRIRDLTGPRKQGPKPIRRKDTAK